MTKPGLLPVPSTGLGEVGRPRVLQTGRQSPDRRESKALLRQFSVDNQTFLLAGRQIAIRLGRQSKNRNNDATKITKTALQNSWLQTIKQERARVIIP